MKVAILVVAYNAMETLAAVLDRIPPEQMERVSEVVVFDDASVDHTYERGLTYKQHTQNPKLTMFRNERNLGYGGNQKRGYTYCIEKGYDAVVMLHGDGQYAPEAMGGLLDTLESTGADAVFGSRMMTPGAARRGGMPLYKCVGNRILSWTENRLLGMSLSEFHSGYRVYRCVALAQIPFSLNTNDFHFDTEIIVQFHERGLKIVEAPIPTYYGDEICYVNGMKYARDVVVAVLRYRLHKLGFIYDPKYDVNPAKYGFHSTLRSAHGQVLALVPDDSSVLDVGCGPGHVSERLRARGCTVVGLDRTLSAEARARLDCGYECDLEGEWPAELQDERFDVVLLGDVLEHMRAPDGVIAEARRHLRPGGRVIVSVPNVAHFWVRLNLLLGRFEYAERGILDTAHLRFFTRPSLMRMLKAAGLRVTRTSGTPLPFVAFYPPGQAPRFVRALECLSYLTARAWPGLFAYEHVAVAESAGGDPTHLPPGVGRIQYGDDVVDAQHVDRQQDDRVQPR